MRRFATVLLAGTAALVTGLAPAGALNLERERSRRFHLDCQLVRRDAGPAVSCTWSAGEGALGYRLHRIERGEERQVVSRGAATRFLDETVLPGQAYAYRVFAHPGAEQDVRSDRDVARSGRWSNVAKVAVPSPGDLRVACRPVDGPAVACEWSELERPGVAGYRLLRGGDARRRVVYRGERTRHLDEEVEAGGRYRYVAQALDGRGRIIGSSRPVGVRVPPVPPTTIPGRPVPARPVSPEAAVPPRAPLPGDPRHLTSDPVRPVEPSSPAPTVAVRPVRPVEPLPPVEDPATRPVEDPTRPVEAVALRCAPVTEGAGIAVACTWSSPRGLDPAGYRLWRSTADGRSVIFVTRTETSFLDRDVRPGTPSYLVEALDGQGRVIGRSPVVRVKVGAADAETGDEAPTRR